MELKPEVGGVDTSLNLNLTPSRQMDVVVAGDDEGLVEELHRLSSENKRLTETLSHMCESYNVLQNQLRKFMIISNPDPIISPQSRNKRKADDIDHYKNYNMLTDQCSTITSSDQKDSSTTPNVSTVLVRTQPSDTSLYVRDGYQWRKYGQKVTRDNPSPRAYFKCSFAPTCPVKKKVQRSIEDPRVLVATYEGEHNHGSQGSVAVSSSDSDHTLHQLVGSSSSVGLMPQIHVQNSLHHFLVQQMANSFTTDPNFRAALATAISARMLPPTSM